MTNFILFILTFPVLVVLCILCAVVARISGGVMWVASKVLGWATNSALFLLSGIQGRAASIEAKGLAVMGQKNV